MLPHDLLIEIELLILLHASGPMRSFDVYSALEQRFPDLRPDETRAPYQNSVSRLANRVQWTVEHLRERGCLRRNGERGLWELSDEEARGDPPTRPDVDAMLAELDAYSSAPSDASAPRVGHEFGGR